MVFAGAALILAGVIAGSLGHIRQHAGNKRYSGVKGVGLSVAAGLILGGFFPAVQSSTTSEIGLGPYTATVFAALGALLASPVLSVFVMNLPIHGEPASFKGFFRKPAGGHIQAIVAGVLWALGLAAILATLAASRNLRLSGHLPFAALLGGAVVAALSGIGLWKDLSNGDSKSGPLTYAMVGLFAAGVAVLALA
ncbi:MAG: hypothetical protein FJW30_12630 [Acidobacteria bacterium]|nr:hypothetical protein [Acidobacteriota bacterium]